MKLSELLSLLIIDEPITLYLYDPAEKKSELIFKGFVMDIEHQAVAYLGEIDPSEWDVTKVYTDKLMTYDMRYDADCYTDELVVCIKKGEEPEMPRENLHLVAIAYSAYQDEETSFCTRYFIANTEEEAEELALGRLMRELHSNGKHDAILIEAVAVTKA